MIDSRLRYKRPCVEGAADTDLSVLPFADWLVKVVIMYLCNGTLVVIYCQGYLPYMNG